MRLFGAAHPADQLWLAEYGSIEDAGQAGRKAQWFTAARSLFKSAGWEQFRGVLYFHSPRVCSWWVDSSTSARNAFAAMGADAYGRLPAYRETADRCADAFIDAGFASPLPYLVGELDRDWSRTEIQGAQFTHAVGLAEAWRFYGVSPEMTVGHSLGEVAAAYVAGTISLPDAVVLVGARAGVVDRLTGRYAMAVLGVGAQETESVLADTAGWLEISAVNGPSSTVVSGDHDAVAALVQLAGQRGIFTHQLSVDYPGHTSALRQLSSSLIELIPDSAFRDAAVPFVGSTFGAEVRSDT